MSESNQVRVALGSALVLVVAFFVWFDASCTEARNASLVFRGTKSHAYSVCMYRSYFKDRLAQANCRGYAVEQATDARTLFLAR